MKKITVPLSLVLASNVYSQNSSEERANEITNEMSEVPSMDEKLIIKRKLYVIFVSTKNHYQFLK